MHGGRCAVLVARQLTVGGGSTSMEQSAEAPGADFFFSGRGAGGLTALRFPHDARRRRRRRPFYRASRICLSSTTMPMLFIPDDVAASLLATLDSAVASQLPMSFGQLRAQLSSAMQGPQQAISQQQTPATCLPESTTPLPLLPERVPGPSISRRMNASPYERPRRVGRCHSLPPVRRVVLLDEDILGDSPLEAPADNWPLQPPPPLSPDLTTGQTSTGSSPTISPRQPTTAGKVVFPLDLTSIRPSRSPMRSPSPISPLSPSQSPSPQYRWLAVGENANNPANNPGLDEEDHDVDMQDHFGTHHGPLPVGGGEDEDTAPNLSGIKITIPSVRDPVDVLLLEVQAEGEGGPPGGPPAHLWTDDCIRRGIVEA
ncbi:hypothetical protein B0H10DRAFT_2207938 [Mycena sp. CBHHK59/15]|nr:hypothetical protein B0H10DRAFT_2207938 [Mycena sp. CBHHK59/15]